MKFDVIHLALDRDPEVGVTLMFVNLSDVPCLVRVRAQQAPKVTDVENDDCVEQENELEIVALSPREMDIGRFMHPTTRSTGLVSHHVVV